MDLEEMDPVRLAVVAIDGPSGSGKSSVAKGVARELGLVYLDTGAMYRAITWWMLRHGVDIHDPAAVAEMADVPKVRSGTDPEAPTISVDGEDVSSAIREQEVTAAVSAVSAVPEVRARLVELQRAAVAAARADRRGTVLEGRDIGTVVLPDADVKVFLTAHPSVRAARRAAEDVGAGRRALGIDETQAALERRDALDSQRASSPLTRADDAVEVDSSELGLAEVIGEVVALVRQKKERQPRSRA